MISSFFFLSIPLNILFLFLDLHWLGIPRKGWMEAVFYLLLISKGKSSILGMVFALESGSFTRLRKHVSIPTKFVSKIMKWCWILSSYFLHFTKMIIWFYSFGELYWLMFKYLTKYLHSLNEPNLIVMYYLFKNILLDLIRQ